MSPWWGYEAEIRWHSVSSAGGVIAYISSASSSSSPESCHSDSSNGSYQSSSPPHNSFPSWRQARPADAPLSSPNQAPQRGHSNPKAGRTPSTPKCGITSEWWQRRIVTWRMRFIARYYRGERRVTAAVVTNACLCLVLQRSTGWSCSVRCVETWPQGFTTAFTPARAARWGWGPRTGPWPTVTAAQSQSTEMG